MRIFLALGLLVVSTTIANAQDEVIRYSRDIRPLLSNKCFVCHGPDESTRKAGLRLDTFADATRDLGGYAAIIPGNVEDSELWYHITSDEC